MDEISLLFTPLFFCAVLIPSVICLNVLSFLHLFLLSSIDAMCCPLTFLNSFAHCPYSLEPIHSFIIIHSNVHTFTPTLVFSHSIVGPNVTTFPLPILFSMCDRVVCFISVDHGPSVVKLTMATVSMDYWDGVWV